jgi:hypothetical protein
MGSKKVKSPKYDNERALYFLQGKKEFGVPLGVLHGHGEVFSES